MQIISDLNISPWFKIVLKPLSSLIYICAYWHDQQKLTFIELSVPFETNTEKAHNYKESKYVHLINDLESKGFTVKYFAIEFGSRGHITPQNKTRLNSILTEFGKPVPLKDFRNTITGNHIFIHNLLRQKQPKIGNWNSTQDNSNLNTVTEIPNLIIAVNHPAAMQSPSLEPWTISINTVLHIIRVRLQTTL